jgi:hypothetical protein
MLTKKPINVSTSFMGMLLLLVGLGAGIVVVSTPQLMSNKAQSVGYNMCNPDLSCSTVVFNATSDCINNSGFPERCCSPGQKIIDYYCVAENSVPDMKWCAFTDSCSDKPTKGASACLENGLNVKYCCPSGTTLGISTNGTYGCIDSNHKLPTYGTGLSSCPSGVSCQNQPVIYGFSCINTYSSLKSCCPSGFKILNNTCVLK